MFDMLDVAIGLAFLYVIMSLVATAGVEILEAVLQYRARDLEHGIREMLDDPDLTKQLYNHPLIASLYKGDYKGHGPNERVWRWTYKWTWWKWRLPSYVPSRNFALAMMDIVVPNGITGATTQPETTKIEAANLPVVGEADRAKSAIVKLIAAANRDAAAARANIEDWFNSSMDRVSGWYKRRTQWFLLVSGIVVALTLNVDSIKIARQLATNKAVRESAVAAATEWNKAHAQLVVQTSTIDPNSDPGKALDTKVKAFDKQYQDAQVQLKKAGLPIGWERPWCEYWYDPKLGTGDYMLKLIGILITASAVSLGAPFWFDLLNKFIVVRSTVKPEEKSNTEAPKEPTKK